jgi:hypothetical protein
MSEFTFSVKKEEEKKEAAPAPAAEGDEGDDGDDGPAPVSLTYPFLNTSDGNVGMFSRY